MPLIACPDCGRDVSTAAPSCPHCGRPSPGASAPLSPPAAVPAASAEQTLWRGRPSLILLAGKILLIVLTVIVLPILLHLVVRSSSLALDVERSSNFLRVGWIVIAIIVLIETTLFLIALAKVKSTLYTVTTQRVMIESGLFHKAVEDIDMRYIEDTQFYQRFLDRILGIGNVTLISADKSTPTKILQGVADPRGLRELIRSHAYQVSQRQLFTRAT